MENIHHTAGFHAHACHRVGPDLIGLADEKKHRVVVHPGLHAVFQHELAVLDRGIPAAHAAGTKMRVFRRKLLCFAVCLCPKKRPEPVQDALALGFVRKITERNRFPGIGVDSSQRHVVGFRLRKRPGGRKIEAVFYSVRPGRKAVCIFIPPLERSGKDPLRVCECLRVGHAFACRHIEPQRRLRLHRGRAEAGQRRVFFEPAAVFQFVLAHKLNEFGQHVR